MENATPLWQEEDEAEEEVTTVGEWVIQQQGDERGTEGKRRRKEGIIHCANIKFCPMGVYKRVLPSFSSIFSHSKHKCRFVKAGVESQTVLFYNFRPRKEYNKFSQWPRLL